MNEQPIPYPNPANPGAWGPPPSWQPWPAPAAEVPAAQPRHAAPPGASRRWLGAGGAGALGLLKYGAVLLKLGKLGPMVISMLVSVVIFAGLFGPAYGIGVVALILVHEMGHVIAARIERVPASLPFFLGPFGALILTKRESRDARQDAVIGIGGPLLGTIGTLLVALWASATPAGRGHDLLLALAYFGFFINLFNLTPMLPFDGGRVAGAVSIWLNIVGVVIMGALILLPGTGVGVNPFLLLLFVLGLFTTVQRFRNRKATDFYTAVPPRVRAVIFAAWAALIVVTAVGMNLSHRALVDRGTIDRPGATTVEDTQAS